MLMDKKNLTYEVSEGLIFFVPLVFGFYYFFPYNVKILTKTKKIFDYGCNEFFCKCFGINKYQRIMKITGLERKLQTMEGRVAIAPI